MLLADSFILLFVGIFIYWVFNRTNLLVVHRFDVIYTLLMYVLLSFIGSRCFRTYAGILRYSSFIDLVNCMNLSFISVRIRTATTTRMAIHGSFSQTTGARQ